MNPKLREFLRVPSFKRWLRSLPVSLAAVYAGLALFAWFCAEGIIFHPPKTVYADNPDYLKLAAADGNRITAVYLPNPQAEHVLLFSHGNAEDLQDTQLFLEDCRKRGWAVFAYDYPGYGTSTGRPTEAGCYAAINAAYQYLTEKLKIPAANIVLYGRSVGTGPTVDLASREPVGGVILESAFTSTFRVTIPYRVLPWDIFDNIAKISRVHAPLLSIHGESDTTIPLWHGQAVNAAHPGLTQHLWIPGANHNTVMETAPDTYWAAIEKFRQSLPPVGPLKPFAPATQK